MRCIKTSGIKKFFCRSKHLFFIALAFQFSCRHTSSNESQPLVLNGEEVKAEDAIAKAVLALKKNSQGESDTFCTATAIGPRQIVSAAHCFDEQGQHVRIGSGIRVELNIEAKITHITMHPSYRIVNNGREEPGFDIALLLLDRDLPKDHVIYAMLTPEPPQENSKISIAGYGYSEIERESEDWYPGVGKPTKLLQAEMTVEEVGKEKPDIQLHSPIYTNCSGDSGGPAYLQGDDNSITLLGVSSSSNCHTNADPQKRKGSYTDVFRYRDWIECSYANHGHPLPRSTLTALSARCKLFPKLSNIQEYIAHVKKLCQNCGYADWDLVDDEHCQPVTKEACESYGSKWNATTGKCD